MKRNKSTKKRINEKINNILIEFQSIQDPARDTTQAIAFYVIGKILQSKVAKKIKSITFQGKDFIVKLKNNFKRKKPPK